MHSDQVTQVYYPNPEETMLEKFCERLYQAISDAVARGVSDGLARGASVATGEHFDPPALTDESKPKRTAKKK